MIKFNYTQVEQDFQSIYNLHEVVMSLALPLIPSIRDKTLSLEQLTSLMNVDTVAEDALFPEFSPAEDFIKAMNVSFNHYGNAFVGVKTVNALNCRKSAILSQMLLRHKVMALRGLKPSKAETKSLFNDLMVQYCGIFTTTQTLIFDLAPYLDYLPECGAAVDGTPSDIV